MLNPFFIQGTNTEQGLLQDLINEQIKMYGIEVYYMPRRIINKGKVIKDAIFSKFKNAFPIEAYLVNYEGFDNNSVLMSKFGVRITDEMTLIISKERFDTYIGEIMELAEGLDNLSRPNEGDLIYIPLSNSLMEIKYVENRKPFYQLQKNYVYELRCELFEYEDEEINTGVPQIDQDLKDLGYGAILSLSGLGITATAYTGIVTGGIQKIDVVSGGYRYSSAPSLVVSAPISGIRAIAVGVMTDVRGLASSKSVDKIYLNNPGAGYSYSSPPNVEFFGGNGYGTQVKVAISTSGSVGIVTLTYAGTGYVSAPTVTFSSPVSGGSTAIAQAFLNASGGISTIRIIDAGYGYTSAPTITISAGSTIASGNYIFGEQVTGSISGAIGIVKDWESSTRKLKVSGMGTDFVLGDVVVGAASSAQYIIGGYQTYELQEPSYDYNQEIEEEADDIVDFTEINPFGEV
jgi:hypothetical protein